MFSITPSHIIEHLYCPRYTYFQYVLKLGQNEEKYYKAIKGRDVHKTRALSNKDYLRKKLNVLRKETDVYLCASGLRGIIDEILFFENNHAAPLDYKFAEYKEKVYSTYKTQLSCYAVLIENNYNVSVNTGYLVYIRSKNKVIDIEISNEDKEKVNECSREIERVISSELFPPSTKSKSRCNTCTFSNLCPE